jgi:hypothetical protein
LSCKTISHKEDTAYCPKKTKEKTEGELIKNSEKKKGS